VLSALLSAGHRQIFETLEDAVKVLADDLCSLEG